MPGMKSAALACLEKRDGYDVGRDPDEMSAGELLQAGHGDFPPVPNSAQKTGGQNIASGFDGGLPPNDMGGDFLPKKLTINPEGVK